MTKTNGKYERDSGAPWGFFAAFLVCAILYVGVCFFGMSYIYKACRSEVTLLLAVVAVLLSVFVGYRMGGAVATLYGKRSIKYINILMLLVVVAVAVYGWVYFCSGPLAEYQGSEKFVMIMLGVALGGEPLAQAVGALSDTKLMYCPHCDTTNVMYREEKENEEVAYGYEFRDHSSQKERAIIRDRDTYESYEVTYKTPGYQENLGLHKYHKYTQVFRCKCCGYEKREAARDVTKV